MVDRFLRHLYPGSIGIGASDVWKPHHRGGTSHGCVGLVCGILYGNVHRGFRYEHW